jgi:hypothetical protein
MPDPIYLYRRSKTRVFEGVLKPLGYVEGKELFARSFNSQLHGIEFQGNTKRAGEYFVNLAFSFDFLPPFLQARNAVDIPWPQYTILDFLFWSRIGSFLPKPYIDAWEYDQLNAEEIEAMVRKNIIDALGVFDLLGGKWGDPQAFLKLFPPEIIKTDDDLRNERYEAEKKKILWEGTLPLTELIGEAWHWKHHNLAYACGIIAGRGGKLVLAKQYLIVARETDHFFGNMPKAAWEKLVLSAGLDPSELAQ